MTLGKIHLGWFPRPTVTIDDRSIVFDERTQGKIRTTKVRPSIRDLLMGRVVVLRAQLKGSRVQVHLPGLSKQPLVVQELEKSLRSAVTFFTRELSGLRIGFSGGSVVIEIRDRPPVVLEDLDAEAVASSAALRFKLSARLPFTIALMRPGGTAISRASLLMLMPMGFMNSSRRISPGWIGSSSFLCVINAPY